MTDLLLLLHRQGHFCAQRVMAAPATGAIIMEIELPLLASILLLWPIRPQLNLLAGGILRCSLHISEQLVIERGHGIANQREYQRGPLWHIFMRASRDIGTSGVVFSPGYRHECRKRLVGHWRIVAMVHSWLLMG